MSLFVGVSWTVGDVLTEAKLDQMVSNSQSENAHAANGMIMNNNVPYKAKNAGGTTKNILNKNTSDQTTIGENNVRATRFVAIAPRVQVLSTNPANTNWTDLDVTASTSSRTFMVIGHSRIQDTGGANLSLHVRRNGDADVQDDFSSILSTRGSVEKMFTSFQVAVDTSQIFEWSVTSADMDSLLFMLTGYWEYVD